MRYQIKKRWGHEEGLSATFRQFRAPETHCSKLHGYALAVELTFESDTLDHRNWVISFGELKEVKQWLKDTFDHQTLISVNDPELDYFERGEELGVLQLVVVDEVGCEKFAEMIAHNVIRILRDKLLASDAWLSSVTVSEHGGNSATVKLTEEEFTDILCDVDLGTETVEDGRTVYETEALEGWSAQQIATFFRELMQPRAATYVTVADREPATAVRFTPSNINPVW